ncbi:MarR family transcriptional regulator [Novosphingobium aureum]|uniref:MarR family winged helix-turn-helix transcriptional regulator n=1 Tax=Novosphingobium aureum TaxID=2792964 RepID=UPI002B475DE6|nr:MarR family transcriptional regulator [Novosphingobium aureum]
MQDPAPNDDPLCLDRQLCFQFYAASNLIGRLYAPVLAKLNLTYSQYLVMLVLWETDGQSVGAIGKRLHLDTGTLTPLLKRMETLGHLVRQRDKEDERRVRVSLTPRGKALREQALEIPEIMTRGQNPEELEALRRTLADVVNMLSAALASRQ